VVTALARDWPDLAAPDPVPADVAPRPRTGRVRAGRGRVRAGRGLRPRGGPSDVDRNDRLR